ncbi:hypothetical protein KXD40_003171 [Peronospora effusa]|nr:hypothetical protein KXD40_003171 [Peronospora effusa]
MLSIGILWSRCTVEFWPTYCVKLHRSSSSLVHEYWSLTRSSWPLLMAFNDQAVCNADTIRVKETASVFPL